MKENDSGKAGVTGRDGEQDVICADGSADWKELDGLTIREVEERIAGGLGNHADITTGKSAGQIVRSNLFTYFNLIFLILAVLLCVVRSYRSLTFLPVVIGNIIIGIVQELRAKRILDKMNMLNAPSTVVVREGVQSRIPSEELVQDDVVVLSAGNQICADARVLEGSISVNESPLTGEADEIKKEAGSTLLSGSFVVSGQCHAKLEHVGEASYISRLTAQAKAMGSGEQSEMVRSINQLVKWVGILIIPVGIVLFAQAYFMNGETIRTSIVSMIAAIIGMIPEGLYLLTTAALALSTIRLAGRKVLLHDMKSIEALARVDVLCVDKTGTITEPGMQVAGILPCGGGVGPDVLCQEKQEAEPDVLWQGKQGVGPDVLCQAKQEAEPDVLWQGKQGVGPDVLCQAKQEAEPDVLWQGKQGVDPDVLCQGKQEAGLDGTCPGKRELVELLADYAEAISDNNATMQAIRQYVAGFSKGDVCRERKIAVSTLPFSSARKYSAIQFADGKYVLGAPEFVLQEDYSSVSGEIAPCLKKGYRVLVIGKCEMNAQDGSALGDLETVEDALDRSALGDLETAEDARNRSMMEDLETAEDAQNRSAPEDLETAEEPLGKVHPLGYVILTNPIRENAVETFSYFKEQGVTVKVISGDNPETVSEVARRAGIEGAERFMDARAFGTEEELGEAAGRYTVFGRVTPRQKQILVRALRESGHTVAMTGDGVNDILAMKDADCSVAMASGSEAAAQAAQVVLLDSDFAHMPSVVWEGRRVVNNIQRSASLFLVKNIFSLLLALFSAVLTITYPLEPSQISLIGMFTIGIPGFLLALEPNRNRIEGHFIRNILLKAFPAGLTDVLAVGALVICGQAFSLPKEDIATASTMLLAVVGFMILARISYPFNRMKWGILALNISGLLFSGIFLGRLFAMSEMSQICILLMVVVAFAAESLFRYLSMVTEKMSCGEWGVKLRKAVELVLCKMEG